MNGRIPAGKPVIGEEEEEAVLRVLRSGQLAAGPEVRAFEKSFAEYVGVEEAVAVSSGTAAIHLSLLSLGIGKGDKVIVSPYSFVASVSPVLAVGAEPIFVDIDPVTYCMAPENMVDVIDHDTRAIIPVHLYGQMADMDGILKVAEENELKVIEDACQAHGAMYRDKIAGSVGHAGCFSFYATKNMTTGEGGMITTDDKELAETARMLRTHGKGPQGEHETCGFNYLMTDMEACLGRVQLDKLDSMNDTRRRNASIITEEMAPLEESGIVRTPVEVEGRKHVYHQYALRVSREKRDPLVFGMRKAGVDLRIGYDRPIYRQGFVNMDSPCPETESACQEVVWAPVHPVLDPSHMRRIAWGLKQLLR